VIVNAQGLWDPLQMATLYARCHYFAQCPLLYPLCIEYQDLEEMILERGVEVDHTTIFRWVQAYVTELDKRIRPHLNSTNDSWKVDLECDCLNFDLKQLSIG